MKRIIAIFLSIVLVVSMFAGCSDGNKTCSKCGSTLTDAGSCTKCEADRMKQYANDALKNKIEFDNMLEDYYDSQAKAKGR